eukprot:GHVH01004006.1.p1 GENE.GHVH01004006.1~~GHVH01004006.1.p1  ORF type:complete len:627 (+),score=103.33 GHVH01004006.1:22-1902(+)
MSNEVVTRKKPEDDVTNQQAKKFNVNLKNKRQRKTTYKLWDTVQRQSSDKLTDREITELLDTVIGPPGARLSGSVLAKRLQLQASSRALQTVLKRGNDEHKAALYEAVCCDKSNDAKVLLSTCNNKFGFILMSKIVRDIPESFADITGKMIKISGDMFISRKGSLVWEFVHYFILHRKGISNEDRNSLLNHLFNSVVVAPHLLVLHPEVKHKKFDEFVQSFSDREKKTVIKDLGEKIDKMIQKRIFKPVCLPLAIRSYLQLCDQEHRSALVKRLMTVGDREPGVFAEVLQLLSTMEGTELFCQLYGYLGTKDRRNLNSVMRSKDDFCRKLFTTEGVGGANPNAWLSVLRIVSTLDDTKQSFDLIKSAMRGGCVHAARAGEDTARIEDCQMRSFLLGANLNPKRGVFVAPRGQALIVKAMTLKELTENEKKTYHSNVKHLSILEQPSQASKKDMKTRASELRDRLSRLTSDFFAYHLSLSDEEIKIAALQGELRDLLSETLLARAEHNDFVLMDSQILPLFANEQELQFFGRNRVVRGLVSIAKSNPSHSKLIFDAVFGSRMHKALSTDLVWPLTSFCEGFQNEELDFPDKKSILKCIRKGVSALSEPFPNMKKGGEMQLAAVLKNV